MKDFIHRTIESDLVEVPSIKGEISFEMKFLRTRTSNGFRCITAKFGGTEMKFSSDDFGDNYEQVALEFAKGLQDMAYKSCLLPKSPETDSK